MCRSEPRGYCHVTPERLRVRVSGLKNNYRACRSLQLLMASQTGVQYVRANPTTGNVLVRFDANILTPDQVLQGLTDLGHFPAPIHQSPKLPSSENLLIEIGLSLGKSLAKATLKQALQGSLAALVVELL